MLQPRHSHGPEQMARIVLRSVFLAQGPPQRSGGLIAVPLSGSGACATPSGHTTVWFESLRYSFGPPSPSPRPTPGLSPAGLQ